MHWFTLSVIFATAVLGKKPSQSPNIEPFTIPPALMDQGDGFYLAGFNKHGAATVEFFPTGDLQARAAAPVSESLAARDVKVLSKREKFCSGHSSHIGHLNQANVRLANDAERWYDKAAWGWVHNGDQTSFFCNYRRDYLTTELIIDMHTAVSSACGGSSAYGYDSRTNADGFVDLTVGRTFKGDEFCNSAFLKLATT